MNIHQARLREAAIRRASIMAEARKAGASGIKRAYLIERLKLTDSNANHALARLVEEGKLHKANDGKKEATYFAKLEWAERASIIVVTEVGRVRFKPDAQVVIPEGVKVQECPPFVPLRPWTNTHWQ